MFTRGGMSVTSSSGEMEYEGIAMESSVLKSMSQDFSIEIENLTRKIFKLAGEEFNLNSGRQLGQVLFEKLALDPNAQRTKKLVSIKQVKVCSRN